jgi:hypothetical protein
MSIFDNPSTGGSWLDAPLKAEGTALSSSGDSYTYNTVGRYAPTPQVSFKEGDRTIVVSEMLMRLEYILQRAVPNYDELSEQFNAIRDIQRSNNDIR